jgi:hypothetical protein
MNEANLNACGPLCRDLLGPNSFADSRSMGTWLLTQFAARGQGTFVDPARRDALILGHRYERVHDVLRSLSEY